MNIEDVIKLKESGFTIDEIKQLMDTNPPQMKDEQKEVLDNQEKVLDTKEVLDKKEVLEKDSGGQLNAFEEMMNQFKESMNQQMEAFKETIHLSNMNQNLGNLDSNDSKKIAEEFTAKIINPKYKK